VFNVYNLTAMPWFTQKSLTTLMPLSNKTGRTLTRMQKAATSPQTLVAAQVCPPAVGVVRRERKDLNPHPSR